MTETAELQSGLAIQINATEEDLADLERDYEESKKRLKKDLDRLEGERAHLSAGITPDTRHEALEIVSIYGDVGRLDHTCITDAVKDLNSGCHQLRDCWFGVKDYDRFRGQRHDSKRTAGDWPHSPRHGSIVFAVGLTPGAVDLLDRWGQLPKEAVSAAVIYLLNLQKAGRV